MNKYQRLTSLWRPAVSSRRRCASTLGAILNAISLKRISDANFASIGPTGLASLLTIVLAQG